VLFFGYNSKYDQLCTAITKHLKKKLTLCIFSNQKISSKNKSKTFDIDPIIEELYGCKKEKEHQEPY